MGRKVAGFAAATIAVLLSVVLVGGQVGSGGFLWWGNHEPIYIYGNSGFTLENGVLSGSGTADDPYIIEGWRIDHPRADYGIYVAHTTAHFIIRDCVVEGARQAGIYFNSVRNGRVENVQIGLCGTAIHLLNASFNRFEGNVIAESQLGIVAAANSFGNVVSGNSFLNNGLNGVDPDARNHWYADGVGNYWSDYAGYDANRDGIGDVPYFRLYDRYPLMVPPVEWTRVAPAGPSHAGYQVAPDGSLVVTSETPITLSAMDRGAGVAEIRYTLDGGLTWAVYTSPIYLTGRDGPRKLSYYAVDHLGNAERPNTVSLMLDNHPPVTRIEIGEPRYEDDRGVWITSASRISLHLEQHSEFGWTQTFYRVDGCGWQRYTRPFTVMGPDGPRRISFYSINASGVTERVTTVVVIKDDAPPHTRGARAQAPTTGVHIGVVAPPDEPTAPPSEDPTAEDPTTQEPIVEQTPPAVVEEPDEDPEAAADASIIPELPADPAPETPVQTPSEAP